MCYVNRVEFVSQYCTCHIATVCLDDPITSKNDDVNKKRFAITASLFLLLHQTPFQEKQRGGGQRDATKVPATTGVTNVLRARHKNKPGCNLSISAGLKSSAIADGPKRVLCPFQEDCLVKLDYIS